MSVTPINLDALAAFDSLDVPRVAGKPLLLDIERVHEDPSQPRKTFDDIKQLELSASIAQSGIRVPVSVRPHPTIPGDYMLNFGARRRRAAIGAGLTHLPALIEELMTDFDQVVENLQRAELTPMEMALFIADKQKEGIKPAEIARRLGLTRSAISKYFALVDAPAEIEAVYCAGRTTSPDTIYELRSVFTRWPAETRAWLDTNVEVTRRTIDEFKRSLAAEDRAKLSTHGPPLIRADPLGIRRPVVVIRLEGRNGILVLNRKAAGNDQVVVKWDDTGQAEDVLTSALVLVRLDDARRYEPLNRGVRRKPRGGRGGGGTQ